MGDGIDLLTVGRVNLDLYAQQTGVEFGDVAGFDAMVGGSPANIAVAAARLGMRAGLFTAVGDDQVGEWVLRALERESVRTAFIPRKQGVHTSLALLAQIPPDRYPRTFYRDDPADIHLTLAEAMRLPLDNVGAVLVSADAFARGSTARTCGWLLHACQELRKTVYVDLDLRPENWPTLDSYADSVAPAVEHADVVLGTVEEFATLLRLEPSSEEVLAQTLRARLLTTPDRVIVLKRGAGGATILRSEGELAIPSHAVPISSTVGAGDAFAAGLIVARINGRDWADAGQVANACGAITVSRPGCSRGFPVPADLAAFVAEDLLREATVAHVR